jgi:hypothetical protein
VRTIYPMLTGVDYESVVKLLFVRGFAFHEDDSDCPIVRSCDPGAK